MKRKEVTEEWGMRKEEGEGGKYDCPLRTIPMRYLKPVLFILKKIEFGLSCC